jgi:hypothetical protein
LLVCFLLLQPSSASVERVFSMLRATITEQQEKMLEDQQELRIRTRYSMKKKRCRSRGNVEKVYFSGSRRGDSVTFAACGAFYY